MVAPEIENKPDQMSRVKIWPLFFLNTFFLFPLDLELPSIWQCDSSCRRSL